MKNVTKAITAACLISMSTQTLAIQSQRVVKRAQVIVKSLSIQADTLTQKELKFINNKMNAIKSVLNGNGVPSKPGSLETIYEAVCWLDDDPSFDYNQTKGGTLTGTISEIISECDYRAKATYSSMGTAGISDLKVIEEAPHASAYECHVDDDPSHDFNQDIIGVLVTKNSQQAVEQCAQIADMMYGSIGSSAIKF